MKKLFFFPILLMAGSVLAQETAVTTTTSSKETPSGKFGFLYSPTENPGVRFGVRGGLSFSRFAPSTDITDAASVSGGNVSIYAEVPLQKYIYLQGGVSYVKAGGTYRVKESETSNYASITARPNYLQIPITAVGKMAIGKSANAFAGAGGYFGLAFGGKINMAVEYPNGNIGIGSGDINYSSAGDRYGMAGNGDMKQIDAGMQGMIGVEFSNMTLSGHFSQGLMNVRRGDFGSLKNQVVSINFGFLF